MRNTGRDHQTGDTGVRAGIGVADERLERRNLAAVQHYLPVRTLDRLGRQRRRREYDGGEPMLGKGIGIGFLKLWAGILHRSPIDLVGDRLLSKDELVEHEPHIRARDLRRESGKVESDPITVQEGWNVAFGLVKYDGEADLLVQRRDLGEIELNQDHASGSEALQCGVPDPCDLRIDIVVERLRYAKTQALKWRGRENGRLPR